jgi:hypothetical protein
MYGVGVGLLVRRTLRGVAFRFRYCETINCPLLQLTEVVIQGSGQRVAERPALFCGGFIPCLLLHLGTLTDALKDTDYPAPSKTAGPRQCYEVTLLWCPEQSRRHSIVSISSLESLPSARDLLAPRAPSEVTGPPPAMPETVAPPAAAITEAPPAARPKQHGS